MSATKAVRTDDTRERILAMATHLFSRHGFSSTSISRVAEAARVSKGLIFWHFHSKDQLFRAALERTLTACTIDVGDDLEQLSPTAQVTCLIDEYYAFISEHLASVRFLLSLVLSEDSRPGAVVRQIVELQRSYRDLLAARLEAGRRRGLVPAHVQPLAQANLILATLYGVLLHSFFNSSFLDGAAAPSPEALRRHLKHRLVEELAP